mmetsp:Transcript_24542/g.36365  ORF Transcript_24542/g.36365 Transcript_24542/m.36365 type:complete len:231 (-) Transcript_24542:266-958(-)
MNTSYNDTRKWTGLLILVLAMQKYCNALNAYLFYEDAQCSGTKSIRGSLVYEYDDSTSTETEGFTIDAYNGPCNYFEGGYHDFLNDSDETDSDMIQGFCMTCDEVVGCSASEDSCDEFYTISPANDTDYAEANDQDDNAYIISSAKKFQKRVYSEVFPDETTLSFYPILAGAISMVALLGLVVFKIQDPIIDFFEEKLNREERDGDDDDGDDDGDDTTQGDDSTNYVAIV